MSLKYKIYADRSLLVDVLKNSISPAVLKEFHTSYRNESEILTVTKVLTHLVDTNFEMSLDEMMDYIEELIKEELPPNFKWAIITENPSSTMFSILIKEEPYFKGKVAVFSTLEASLDFLNVNYRESEFNDVDFKILD